MVRALLTDGEWQAVQDDGEMDQNTKSSHISRVKHKIDKMADDSDHLRTHRPGLYERLYEAVCEEDVETRIELLETEVRELNQRVAELESERSPNTNNKYRTKENRTEEGSGED